MSAWPPSLSGVLPYASDAFGFVAQQGRLAEVHCYFADKADKAGDYFFAAYHYAAAEAAARAAFAAATGRKDG